MTKRSSDDEDPLQHFFVIDFFLFVIVVVVVVQRWVKFCYGHIQGEFDLILPSVVFLCLCDIVTRTNGEGKLRREEKKNSHNNIVK